MYGLSKFREAARTASRMLGDLPASRRHWDGGAETLGVALLCAEAGEETLRQEEALANTKPASATSREAWKYAGLNKWCWAAGTNRLEFALILQKLGLDKFGEADTRKKGLLGKRGDAAKLMHKLAQIDKDPGIVYSTSRLERKDLRFAELSGEDIRGAALLFCDLYGAKLDGGADCRNASFEGSEIVSVSANDAQFDGCNFRNARIHGLRARHASFVGADFENAQIEDCVFNNANFYGVLIDMNTPIRRVGLVGACMDKIDLTGTGLFHCDLGGTSLVDALLCETELRNVDLHGAKFQRTDISGSRLQDVNLYRTDLDGLIVDGTEQAEKLNFPAGVQEGARPFQVSPGLREALNEFHGREGASPAIAVMEETLDGLAEEDIGELSPSMAG